MNFKKKSQEKSAQKNETQRKIFKFSKIIIKKSYKISHTLYYTHYQSKIK